MQLSKSRDAGLASMNLQVQHFHNQNIQNNRTMSSTESRKHHSHHSDEQM